jgi:hypothetical protein
MTWLPLLVVRARRARSGPWLNRRPVEGVTVKGRTPIHRGSQATRLMAPLAGVRLIEAPGPDSFGVLCDPVAGTWVAVLGIKGRSFSLLDSDDKQRRLQSYGAVLAGLARPGTPVYRLQWVQRSSPADADGLTRYLAEAAAECRAEQHASYVDLVTRAGPATVAHEGLIALAVHVRHSARAMRHLGRGDPAACELLRRELRILSGQLEHAEVVVTGALDVRELTAACQPQFRRSGAGSPRHGTEATDLHSAPGAPTAVDETWSSYRRDDSWYATFWVAQWPRLEVGPDFLGPLLLGRGRQSVSVTMAPVPAEQAVREVESARTAEAADEELRRRAGFLASARRRRESEGVARRETELADGHAEYRFSGYLTVSAADKAGLETACAEVEQAAHRSHLELRRLYGQQAEAFTWTLPLARGLQ